MTLTSIETKNASGPFLTSLGHRVITDFPVAQPLQRVRIDIRPAQTDLHGVAAFDDIFIEQQEDGLAIGYRMIGVALCIRVSAEMQQAEGALSARLGDTPDARVEHRGVTADKKRDCPGSGRFSDHVGDVADAALVAQRVNTKVAVVND